MKYVRVNDEFAPVNDTANGREIINAYLWNGDRKGFDGAVQLQGHNCNGSNSVVDPDDFPWQSDYTLISIGDNA